MNPSGGESSMQASGLTADGAPAILEERARVLARVPPLGPDATETVSVLVFMLGAERYALPTEHLREVLRCQDFTPVPGTPPHLLGLFNVRGQIVPLFDLRGPLGVAPLPDAATARILVFGGDRVEFGMHADAVTGVTLLRADDILEPPASLAGKTPGWLRGITAETLLVLDGAALLADERLVIDLSDNRGPGAQEKQS